MMATPTADRAVRRGPKAGAESVARIQAWIENLDSMGGRLPTQGRALHLSKICRTLGVSRSTVHQNPAFRNVLVDYAARNGLDLSQKGPSRTPEPQEAKPDPETPDRRDRTIKALERRCAKLEKRQAELVAENVALRARLRRERVVEDDLVDLGGRIQAGPC